MLRVDLRISVPLDELELDPLNTVNVLDPRLSIDFSIDCELPVPIASSTITDAQNAEHREQRSKPVRPDASHDHDEIPKRCRHQLSTPLASKEYLPDGSSSYDTAREALCGRSLTIAPSRNTTTRVAYSAMLGS